MLWLLLALAAVFMILLAVTVPWNRPDEKQALRDFLAEHPSYTVERVAVVEQEVVAVCYRIFYHAPGDPVLHEEFRQYLYEGEQWRISHKIQEK